MRCKVLFLLMLVVASVNGGEVNVHHDAVRALPTCGEYTAPPIAPAAPRRTCAQRSEHLYRAKHSGIGYDILRLEDAQCFVPDALFELLDAIVDTAIRRVAALPHALSGSDRARRVSEIVGAVLVDRGFGFYTPTETLGDALAYRNAQGAPESHVIDCDTSSFIYMTVAAALHMPVSLVEIDQSGGTSGHNYHSVAA